MKNRALLLALALVALFQFQTVALFAQADERGAPEPRGTEPQITGVARARDAKDQAPPFGGGSGSPNLTNHGGTIMSGTVVTQQIFWGTSWKEGVGDKISGLDSFYSGLSGSYYIKTNSEYFASNGSVTDVVTNQGHIIDNSAAPKSGNQTSPILAEVCKVITSPVSNGYYPVYVDTPRGHAGFCAWHSAGYCGATLVQFAFFFNLDNDSGCDPQDSSGLHSQGLAAAVNVSGHEVSEAMTDPHLDAWYDSSGQENSDKCAWKFGTPLVTLSNGSKWKIQGNWSNAAYNASKGFANSKGQLGCLDGGTYK